MRAHKNIRGRVAGVAALAVALGSFAFTARAETLACTAPNDPASGLWSTYGGDLANTRNQTAATSIGLTNANDISPAFVYDAGGDINTTPIVDGGCIFTIAATAGSAGTVIALDAETGDEVWKTTVPTGTAAFGGPVVGAPALAGNLVIAPFNKRGGPFVVAFDRSTGAEVWRTTLDDQRTSGTNASLVEYDGMIFAGFFGSPEPGDTSPEGAERGGFVLLDATTGTPIKKTYSIPDDDFDPTDPSGTYTGAGIWATAAIDTETGMAYVGTSNPHNPQKIHTRSDSILKIDLNRTLEDGITTNPQFGEILAHYEGFRDTMVPGAEKQPACDTAPDVHYTPGVAKFSATCLAIDVDFGASPNLIKTEDGRTLVGNLQKAGWYHLVDTTDMTGVSMTPVGISCLACNAASSAYADGRAFVAGGPPGELVAIDVATGLPAWVGHLTGPTTYNAVSTANGLVWTVDSAGFLNGFDQLTGAQVVKRPLSIDTEGVMAGAYSSSGVAILNDTLYVAATSYVIGFRAS